MSSLAVVQLLLRRLRPLRLLLLLMLWRLLRMLRQLSIGVNKIPLIWRWAVEPYHRPTWLQISSLRPTQLLLLLLLLLLNPLQSPVRPTLPQHLDVPVDNLRGRGVLRVSVVEIGMVRSERRELLWERKVLIGILVGNLVGNLVGDKLLLRIWILLVSLILRDLLSVRVRDDISIVVGCSLRWTEIQI